MENDVKAMNGKRAVGQFHIVSEEMYDRINSYHNLRLIDYRKLKKPTRSTHGSAGYDFYMTRDLVLMPGEDCIVPTCIRCEITDEGIYGWALFMYPKSGLGFKYNMTLANTIGVVDSDYFNTKNDELSNEGHIMIKIINKGDKELVLLAGQKFCQGIFMPYGITYDDADDIKEERNGGFGSSGK